MSNQLRSNRLYSSEIAGRMTMKSSILRKFARKLYWKTREALLAKSHQGVEFDLLGKYADEGRKNGFNSQRGQDYFVATKIFKNMHSGFFVDIGANHPTRDNNTYALEKTLGWSGISIDAQNRYETIWSEHRTTPLVISLISDTPGKVLTFDIVESSSWENMLSGVSASNNHKVKRDKSSDTNIRQKEMVTSSLGEILAGFHNPKIDLLSIDVEGHEIQVLQGIDFNKINIECICLENDNSSDTLRGYLRERGFRLVAHLQGDDIFMRQNA
ncbi:hypothetical protein D3C87_1228750 [compost metagenome]